MKYLTPTELKEFAQQQYTKLRADGVKTSVIWKLIADEAKKRDYRSAKTNAWIKPEYVRFLIHSRSRGAGKSKVQEAPTPTEETPLQLVWGILDNARLSDSQKVEMLKLVRTTLGPKK